MHLEPLYRLILKKALRIVWQHKFLWFFGFFAALLGGSGEIDILIGGAKNLNWGLGFSDIFGQIFKNKGITNFFGDLILRLTSLPTTGIAVLVVILMGIIVLVWLFIISQISLIDTTARLEKGEMTNGKIRHLVGKEYFWKILWLNIVNKVIIYGLLLVLGAPFLIVLERNEGMLFMTPLLVISYIILVPLAIIISFVMRYASCYVILNQKRVWEGIRAGIRLFTQNWLISTEMAVLFFVLNIVVGLLMSLGTLIVAFPFMVGAEILVNISSGSWAWIVMTIGLVLVLGVLAIFGAFFVSFTYAGWTLLFLKLTSGEKQLSRLIRWVAGVGRRRI